jgi:hypothetical protein
MNSVRSAKLVLPALMICAALSACGNDTNTPAVTKKFSSVVTDMKGACVPCHTDPGGTALSKFKIAADNTTTYNGLMSAGLINKSAPEMSPLILAGKGQMMVGTPPAAHSPAALTNAKAAEWIEWIKAGAAND